MISILIVEDDVDFAEILKECLEEDAACQVLAILKNEHDAQSWIHSNDLKHVDCALVDLVIPKAPGQKEANSMAGLRIVKELRQADGFKGTILVLTNSRLLEDGERALQAGCDGYLCKHAPMAEIPSMVAELKLAMQGHVVLVSREMRHVFIREELSTKEARLMELVNEGCSWAEIAQELGYKSANAAATIGYRVFDKILEPYDEQKNVDGNNDKKRIRALEKWRIRTRRPSPSAVSARAGDHADS